MIISENNKPSLEEFKAVMRKTDFILNSDAGTKEKYYANRNGTQLEIDVCDAVREATKRAFAETPYR